MIFNKGQKLRRYGKVGFYIHEKGRRGKRRKNIWRKIYLLLGKKNGKGKVGKYEEKENIFICGGEEKWRSKKKKNFVEEKHFNAEEKKNGNGGKYGGAHLSI